MQKTFAQAVLKVVYPPLCVACKERVDAEGMLCAQCWRQMQLLSGALCPLCALPLLGEAVPAPCDACLQSPPPWRAAAAFALYEGPMRRLVLSLKAGGETRLARPFAAWALPLLQSLGGEDALLVPVPLHWTRLMRRRFNQSALIALHLGRMSGAEVVPDALRRCRATRPLEGLTRIERAEVMEGVFALHPRRSVAGRKVVLIDDVLTTGATLRGASEVLFAAGAREVSVLALARVGKAA